MGQSLILFLWTLLCSSFDGGGKGRGNQHLLPGLLSLDPSGLRELPLCELGPVNVLSGPRPGFRSGADGFSSSISVINAHKKEKSSVLVMCVVSLHFHC